MTREANHVCDVVVRLFYGLSMRCLFTILILCMLWDEVGVLLANCVLFSLEGAFSVSVDVSFNAVAQGGSATITVGSCVCCLVVHW